MEDKFKEFCMGMDEIIHSRYYYNELVAIIQLIQDNPKELTVIDFLLKIPLLKDWQEMTVEKNLFFLETQKIIEIEKTSDFPIRKYRFTVNEAFVKAFKKMTFNEFVLDIDLDEEGFYALLIEISEEVYVDWNNKLIEYWEDNIIKKYSSIDREYALIKERDKQINQFDSDKNLLKFYDVTNLKKLAKKLDLYSKRKISIPIHPDNIFVDLITSMNKLRIALYGRFKQLLQIKTLNELIEKENIAKQANLNTNQYFLDILNLKPTISDKLNYWLEIKDYFKDLYPKTFLSIPIHIYQVYFEPYQLIPEFGYWFLRYYAQQFFKTMWLSKLENELLISEILTVKEVIENIERELKNIDEYKNEANNISSNTNSFNYETPYFSEYTDPKISKAIEYFRIKCGYYKKTLYNHLSDSIHLTVQVYAEQIIKKEYLENKLKELKIKSKSLSKRTETNSKIPNSNQKRVLRLIVEEMKKGVQKTSAIDYASIKAGYKDSRQVWNIFRKVERRELIYKELTEILD